VKIDKGVFEYIYFFGTLKIGLCNDDLVKSLSCYKDDECLMIRAKDGVTTVKLSFIYEGNCIITMIKIKQIKTKSISLKLKNQIYNAVVEMSSKDFQWVVKSLNFLGNYIQFDVNLDSIEFFFSGQSISIKIVISDENGNNHNLKIDINEPFQVILVIFHLRNFTKAAPLSPKINMYLINSKPSLFQYAIELSFKSL